VVNLVFFKLLRSKTKFWQMLGRGTRLCPDLFGPGKDKQVFYVFDYCQNLEFFNLNPDSVDGHAADSLTKRLFTRRLELIGEIDGLYTEVAEKTPDRSPLWSKEDPSTEAEVRCYTASLLHREVAAMNLENFIVRPKRRWVEKYSKSESWLYLPKDVAAELSHEVAGLPSELDPEAEDAKRFDLLLLNLQLALLRSESGYACLRDQVIRIAGLLEEKASIPIVKDQLALIQDIQTEEWWQDVTTPILETVRRHFRSLVKLIEKARRSIVYTDFDDEMGEGTEIELQGISSGEGFEKFLSKARAFLRDHQDPITIHKLRLNKTLTATDLQELEKMLESSGVFGAE
jgi:type I restriction enzyme R subunit